MIWLANILDNEHYNCMELKEYFTKKDKKEQLFYINQWMAILMSEKKYLIRENSGLSSKDLIKDIEANKFDADSPPKCADLIGCMSESIISSLLDNVALPAHEKGFVMTINSKDNTISVCFAIFQDLSKNRLLVFNPLIGVFSFLNSGLDRAAILIDSILKIKYRITTGSISCRSVLSLSPRVLVKQQDGASSVSPPIIKKTTRYEGDII